MKKFARGAMIAAAVTIIGGVGVGAASAHRADVLGSPSHGAQTWVDNSHNPDRPHGQPHRHSRGVDTSE